MKRVTFKRGGVLHWIAVHPGGMSEYDVNICTYVRCILLGLLILLVLTAMTIGCVFALIVPYAITIAWLAAMYTLGAYITPDAGPFLVIGLTIAFYWIWRQKVKHDVKMRQIELGIPEPEEQEKQPSVVGLWYRGLKSRTCFYINFE